MLASREDRSDISDDRGDTSPNGSGRDAVMRPGTKYLQVHQRGGNANDSREYEVPTGSWRLAWPRGPGHAPIAAPAMPRDAADGGRPGGAGTLIRRARSDVRIRGRR